VNQTLDQQRLEAFLGQALTDTGAALSVCLATIGDRLGLYRAMAGAGRLTPAELAARANLAERYVREWLNNQAAGGYVAYDADSGTYELPPEQAACLADDDSPTNVQGGFEATAACFAILDRLAAAFRTGDGIGWHEHDPHVFRGIERFWAPAYRSQLVSTWIPALDGVAEKLEAGARVADVGCGHGISTIVMAEAFPRSTFVGFDYHDASIARAREAAIGSGLDSRVRFEVAGAKDFPGQYDLVCLLDCFHDMGDPVGAARHVLEALAPGGTVLLAEPRAGDEPQDNFNPLGRALYGFSTLLCTPTSLSQDVGLALGACAGPERLRQVLAEAGFQHVRQAAATPVNVVLEVRP
jgi:SAM-dependent methyltransferase